MFHSVRDFDALIENHAPTRACARAVLAGRTTLLGGFTPPGGFPYWILRVEGLHGSVWHFKVQTTQGPTQVRVVPLRGSEGIEYNFWVGDKYPNDPIMAGSEPERIKERVNVAIFIHEDGDSFNVSRLREHWERIRKYGGGVHWNRGGEWRTVPSGVVRNAISDLENLEKYHPGQVPERVGLITWEQTYAQ